MSSAAVVIGASRVKVFSSSVILKYYHPLLLPDEETTFVYLMASVVQKYDPIFSLDKSRCYQVQENNFFHAK